MLTTLEKGLRILELLVMHQRLSVSDVAVQMNINKSASHRFLASLKALGYVDQNSDSRYHLTSRLFDLAATSLTPSNIKEIARPLLAKLSRETGETINLGHWTGDEVFYLDKIESTEMLSANLAIGTPVPAHCTAMGKAMLAYFPKAKLGQYLESVEFKQLTSNTITERQALINEMLLIRKRGFAIDDQEFALGIRCIAVAVWSSGDYPTYSLSVAGPASRMTDEKISNIEKMLLELGSSLSNRLGAKHNRVAESSG
jgi:DNA-binding IclR family transcriptional regulator